MSWKNILKRYWSQKRNWVIIIFKNKGNDMHKKFEYQNWNPNNHSIWTLIELRSPVSESSTKISKSYVLTDCVHKFHKGRIKNWLSSVRSCSERSFSRFFRRIIFNKIIASGSQVYQITRDWHTQNV